MPLKVIPTSHPGFFSLSISLFSVLQGVANLLLLFPLSCQEAVAKTPETISPNKRFLRRLLSQVFCYRDVKAHSPLHGLPQQSHASLPRLWEWLTVNTHVTTALATGLWNFNVLNEGHCWFLIHPVSSWVFLPLLAVFATLLVEVIKCICLSPVPWLSRNFSPKI